MFAFALRIVVAAALALAAVSKLRRLRRFREVVAEVVPPMLVPAAVVALPVVELLVGTAVVVPATSEGALLATLVLLAVFTTFLVLRPAAAAACECFGSVEVLSRGRLPLVRNVVLAAAAGAALWPERPGKQLVAATVLAAALGAVGVGLASGGARVLRTVEGERVDLGLRRSTLLVFWAPSCAPCHQLVDDLNRWHAGPSGRAARLIVVTVGSAVAARDSGLRAPIVLDNVRRTSGAFGVVGRPAALLVERAAVVSGPVYGVPAVRRFLDETGARA
jgi:uncharacterized membrane protein